MLERCDAIILLRTKNVSETLRNPWHKEMKRIAKKQQITSLCLYHAGRK